VKHEPPAYSHTASDGRIHYLHGKVVVLPGGRRQSVFWFAGRTTPGATLAALPAGYRIAESAVTRRPYLRKG
jgi:hypothetical protein